MTSENSATVVSPAALSLYIGRKPQPARAAASTIAARPLDHHIDDPVRYDDHLADRLAVDGALHVVVGKSQCFQFGLRHVAGHFNGGAHLAGHLRSEERRVGKECCSTS